MVDVELAKLRAFSAVLALVRVTKHEVSTRKPNRHAGGPVVPQEVDDSRDPKLAVDERDGIVAHAYRLVTPEAEIVRLTLLVQRQRYASVQQHDSALHGRHLDGSQVAIEHKHR
jgi:hypothetical protein